MKIEITVKWRFLFFVWFLTWAKKKKKVWVDSQGDLYFPYHVRRFIVSHFPPRGTMSPAETSALTTRPGEGQITHLTWPSDGWAIKGQVLYGDQTFFVINHIVCQREKTFSTKQNDYSWINESFYCLESSLFVPL